MLTFIKYAMFMIVLIALILFYFLYTPWGNQQVYNSIGYVLSKKTGLAVDVTSVHIQNFSSLKADMRIEDKYDLKLEGQLEDDFENPYIDMDYRLISNCIQNDICTINDEVNINGHINGPYSRMVVQGEGKALDGAVKYSAIKFTDKIEDLNLTMHDVNSTKLFTLMGHDAFIKGKADVHANFTLMEKNNYQGQLTYDVKDNNFSGLPLNLHTKIMMEGTEHTFLADITSPYMKLNISKGHYDQDKKRANAFYILDVKELSKLESLLGYKYLGPFYAMGEIKYDNYLSISGLSKSYGGMMEYLFEKDGLKIELNAVSFLELMKIFPYPPMLDADATGQIYYNFIEETLAIDTKLKNAKVVHADLVNVIYEKSGVDLLEETFDNSSLDATYHNSILSGDLKLANEESHLFLTDTTMDMTNHSIYAYFDFKVQDQAFSGKVDGSLDDPDVNLNLQKLIKYQMEKQLDSIMGEGATRTMRSIPMESTAEDMATGAAASFMKMFF